MSNKVKKTSSSVSFSLSRWFKKNLTPSRSIIMAIAIMYVIFILGGGLYTLISKPHPSAYVNGQFYFLYPRLSDQFIADTVISVTLYALGFIGVLAIFQASRNAYKPRQAYMLLVIGVALLLLCYIFLEGAVQYKASYGS